MKPYELRRQAAGLCVHCGGPMSPERAGKKRCSRCVEQDRASWQQRYMYRCAHGQCVKCGKPSDGYSYCETCRAYYSKICKQRRDKACQ